MLCPLRLPAGISDVGVASASELEEINADLAAQLHLKVLSYDRSLQARSAGKLVVAVVFRADREESERVHGLMQTAFRERASKSTVLVHGIEELLRPQAQGAPADGVTGDLVLRGIGLLSTAVQSAGDADSGGAGAFRKDASLLRLGAAANVPAEPPDEPLPRERSISLPMGDSVRVTSAKLDRMRDLIGELMLTQARMELSADEFRKARATTREYCEQLAETAGPAARLFTMLLESIAGLQVRMHENSYRIATLVAELDVATRELRMVPIRSLLEQYPVTIREFARELGRQVRLEFDGEAIEVDRSVLERLADPLLHLQVTMVSGRGIGLDVVLTQVEALGGSVEVQSALGQGTVFRLSVPVTLAMTSLLLFEVCTAPYALPAASVVGVVEASGYPVTASIDGAAIRYAGVLIPLVRLDELVGETAESAGRTEATGADRLIIVQRGRELVALSGSSRHREREVVLKVRGKFFARNRLINASVPLEDGTLALTLSVSELFSGPRALRSQPPPAGPAKRKVKTVLVVDDSSVVRDLLAEALRAHGQRVLEAGDGEEALRKLESEPGIDLVVTDVDMPKLDGIGLLQKLRLGKGPRRMPVVIVSMRGSSEDQQRALAAGADAYLVKTDLSHSGLWTMLARFLG